MRSRWNACLLLNKKRNSNHIPPLCGHLLRTPYEKLRWVDARIEGPFPLFLIAVQAMDCWEVYVMTIKVHFDHFPPCLQLFLNFQIITDTTLLRLRHGKIIDVTIILFSHVTSQCAFVWRKQMYLISLLFDNKHSSRGYSSYAICNLKYLLVW